MNIQDETIAESADTPADENTGILVEDMVKIKDVDSDAVLYWGRG